MHSFRPLRTCGLAGALCLLAACAGHSTKPAPVTQAAPPPLTAPYAAAARAGAEVYRLDAGDSYVRVLVDKAGPLSGLGHRHVITVAELRGFAKLDGNGHGQADLRFPVTALTVDPAAAKKIYPDFKSPSEEDIVGTRKHMLGPVLDSSRYPRVLLHVQGTLDGSATGLAVTISLHGIRRTIHVAGSLTRNGPRLEADGEFPVKQSDFDITPYSIMMGALRVRNTIRIRYHLIFSTWCAASSSSKVPTC